ncbi:MAG: 30S ribosomal protein S4, partial [Clostridia bacterium]|nr:30S ribosomal protein S4 [Clostridia bacterium]
NGKPVDIPSFIVKVGDVIAIKENKKEKEMFKDLKGMKVVLPKWIEFNTETLVGKIIALPKREDIDMNISEHLIIELYSR